MPTMNARSLVRRRAAFALALLAMIGSTVQLQAQRESGSDRWESQMSAFAEQDKQSAPPKGEIVFVGSSSIRMWDTDKYFPELKVLNRGFGGSQIADSVEHAGLLVITHEPRIVVLYAGDNDIAAGKTPETVAGDYRAFVKKVHEALPETRILFIAIKPSVRRWSMIDEIRSANALIRESIDKDSRLGYIDVDGPTLGKDGKPRAELFMQDGLHLNADGYELWTSIVMPYLVHTDVK